MLYVSLEPIVGDREKEPGMEGGEGGQGGKRVRNQVPLPAQEGQNPVLQTCRGTVTKKRSRAL